MICKVSSLCTTAMVLCSSIRHQQGPLISQSHLRKSQKTLQTSIESPGWMCLIVFLRKPMGLLHGFYGNVGTCLKIYNSRLWNPNVPIFVGKKSQASTTSGTLSEDGSEPKRAPDGLAPIVIRKISSTETRCSNGPKILA